MIVLLGTFLLTLYNDGGQYMILSIQMNILGDMNALIK